MIKQRASTPRYSLVPVCDNVGVCACMIAIKSPQTHETRNVHTDASEPRTFTILELSSATPILIVICYPTTICQVRFDFLTVSFFLPLSILHSSPFDHYYSFSLMARGEKPNGIYLPPPANLPPRSNRPPLPDREHRSVGARSEAPQRSAIPPYISPLPLDGMSVCVYVFLCACISVYARVNVGLL